MSKAIDTEVHALKTRLRHAEKVIDQQTAELLELKTKAVEVVAELRAEGQRCRSEYVDADSQAIGTGYLDAADLVAEKLVGGK